MLMLQDALVWLAERKQPRTVLTRRSSRGSDARGGDAVMSCVWLSEDAGRALLFSQVKRSLTVSHPRSSVSLVVLMRVGIARFWSVTDAMTRDYSPWHWDLRRVFFSSCHRAILILNSCICVKVFVLTVGRLMDEVKQNFPLGVSAARAPALAGGAHPGFGASVPNQNHDRTARPSSLELFIIKPFVSQWKKLLTIRTCWSSSLGSQTKYYKF